MGRIITRDFKLFNANQFIESLTEGADDQSEERTRIYFYIGNPLGFNKILEYYIDNSADSSELKDIPITAVDEVEGPSGFVGTINNSLSGFGYLVLNTSSGTEPPIGSRLRFKLNNSRVDVGDVRSGRYFENNPQNPENPPNNLTTKKKVYDNMIALKRVNARNVRLTIRKRDWTSGTSYDSWNGDLSPQNPANKTTTANTLEDSNYYVLNTDFDVFMCVRSGSSGSTDSPNITSSAYDANTKLYTSTTDGYIWRHMYSANISDKDFVNTSYIPLSINRPLESTPYNEPIEVNIRYPGSNLANGTYYMRASNSSRRGNGTVVIRVGTSGGVVTSASVVDATGTDFDFLKLNPAKVYSNDVATTAAESTFYNAANATPPVLEVVSPPLGGYGSNCADQLNATNIQAHLKLGNSEQEVDFPVDTDYSQLGLIINPRLPDDTGYVEDDTVSATHAMHIDNVTGNYITGERIYQGSNDSLAEAIVIEWLPNADNVSGILKYIQPNELCAIETSNGEIKVNSFGSGGNVTGRTSTVSSTVNTGTPSDSRGMTFTNGFATPELKYLSGHILNVIDRKTITRAEDQTENINISITY